MSEIGLTNSAILLLSLGEEEAAEVFKHLAPKEAQKIGQTMTRLGAVTKDRIEDVLGRFHERADQESSIGADADGYVRSVLTKALGDDKATFLLDRPAALGAGARRLDRTLLAPRREHDQDLPVVDDALRAHGAVETAAPLGVPGHELHLIPARMKLCTNCR